MQTWTRYWRTVLLWTSALTLLLLLRDLAVQFTGGYATGVPGVQLVLMRTPRTFGFLLPFTGFAAAMLRVSRLGGRDASGLAAIVGSTGVAAYLLLGHVAPWTQAQVLSSLLAEGAVPSIATRPELWARYRELATAATTDPALSVDAGALGFMYHLPAAAGWLAAVLAALGLLAGSWSRPGGSGVARVAQRWAAALFVLLSVTLAHRWGWELAKGSGVAPALAAYGIVAVPLVATLTLAWVTWAARSPVAGRLAGEAGER